MGETKSYNGDIGRLTAVQNELGKRVDKLEKHVSDDHDRLTKVEVNVGVLSEKLQHHLEWHKEMDNSLRGLKISLIILIIQIIANWIILYLTRTQMI